MAKTTPVQFLQQVRNETSKVTWPTRRETVITTIMVFMFVVASSLCFMVVDFFLVRGVGLIISLGH